jgi:type II secretory pathway pseudopilin PulG
MNPSPRSENSEAAFTLTELCVVLVSVAILVLLVLPGLGASKMQSASAGCLYNLRHLQTGCAMYSTDNNDYLMPNSPIGNYPAGWVSPAAENWAPAPANIDPTYYTNSKSLMWPYLNNNLRVFRCPGDMVPSANGTRIRSYSMNSSVLGGLQGNITPLIGYNPGYRVYIKGGDLTSPSPANLFVFADESPASLNDGYLQMGLNSPLFPDIPACYLEGGCGFSFADGHGEIHRWQTTALNIPVRYGYAFVNLIPNNGAQNLDWLWLRRHASSK